MTKKEIKNLIVNGKTKKAFDIILNMAEALDDDDLTDTLFLKYTSYLGNEKDRTRGIISNDNYKTTSNQIISYLLDAIDELEFDDSADGASLTPDQVTAPPVSTNTTSKTILFLASNPSGTGKLQLEKEHSRISKELQDSDFDVKIKTDVSLSAFQKYILKEDPFIVHFSGHGEKSDVELKDAMSRGGLDIDEVESSDDSGIVLFSEDLRKAFVVNTNVIRRLFRSMVKIQNTPIDTVIFNSCYSEEQAKAVAEFVPNVIGTSWSVKDEAAIAFATSFYLGIAEGCNVYQSVDLGIINALAHGEPAERFVLYQNGEKVEL